MLDELNALIIGATYKGLVSHGEVKALEGMLGKDAPQSALSFRRVGEFRVARKGVSWQDND